MFDAKWIIDRKFADLVVQPDLKLRSFKVFSGAGDKPMTQVQFMGEEKVPSRGCVFYGSRQHEGGCRGVSENQG